MIVGLVAFVKDAVRSLTSHVQPIPAPVDLSQFPLVTYQVASHVVGYNFHGADGCTTERVIFDCMAESYGSARTLAQTLAAALSGYSGTFTDNTRVYEIELANIVDRWDDGSKLSCTTVHALITFAD